MDKLWKNVIFSLRRGIIRLFSLDILYEYYLFQSKAVPRLVSELGDRARFDSQPINSPECLLYVSMESNVI